VDVRLRRVLALLVAFALVVVLAVGCTTAEDDGAEEDTADDAPTTDVQAAMVTDVGGLGDKSFNDLAYAGLQMAEEEFGMEIKVLESNEIADYQPNIDQLANAGYNVIFTVGFLMTDTTADSAPVYTDVDFGGIDQFFEGEIADNQVGLNFKEQEAAYLAGIVAGELTTMPDVHESLNDANTIAFVGGMDIPPVERFEVGYIAGAKSVNPDVEIISLYVGNFEDAAKAKELGITAIEQGADIVFAAAGLPGAGVAQACVENGALFIGVDADQYETLPEAQDVIITSAIKRVDQAVYLTTKDVVEGTFMGGDNRLFGLAEEGVGLAPYHNFEDVVPQETKDKVDEAAAAVSAGEVMVPATRDEL
jgi:basic membrane protein A